MSKIIEFPSENDINEDFRDRYINYIKFNLDYCSYRIASEFIRCTDEEKTSIKVIICMALLEAGYDPTNSANLSKFQIDCGIRVTGTINLETFKNSLSYVEKFWKPDSEYYKDIKDLLDRVSLRVEKRKKRSNIIWTTFLVLFVLCAAIGAWTLWDWIGQLIQFIIKK
jgi:hypothetical protein